MVHYEFLPQGCTANKEYYLEVMSPLHKKIRQKCTELWKKKPIKGLHHDNAPAYKSILVLEFLTKNETVVMPQPPYLPDLVTTNFSFFPKLKTPMKETSFVSKIQEKSKK